MGTKGEWLKVSKQAAKGASVALAKSLGWMAAAIFCIQKAAARSYECGANNAVSKICEAGADKLDELEGSDDTESND